MGVLDIFSGGKPGREEEIDINEFLEGISHVDEDTAKAWVEVMKLERAEDVDSITSKLEANNIVVIDISPMLKNKEGIKKSVMELKKVCLEIDGDIGRVSSHQIIAVPEGMRVRKS
ncbi:hypothetical protein BEH94_03225 [Candidatus Altiarchaeales archaeon WOR_SM1_SCG]|nr:hypothetical protein BEH94_03225 [Candidatus Altiarchaeales archaeon WOR_SM1_SCG]